MSKMSTQYGFYLDSEACTGCKTCVVACKDYKKLPADMNFMRIYEYTGGSWEQEGNAWQADIFSYYVPMACNHCVEPSCLEACPTGAITKNAHGFVTINEAVCVGSQACKPACPYGALQFNHQTMRMNNCNGCEERVIEGKQPICVESCPLRALELLPIQELRQKRGNIMDVAPLPPSSLTKPNIAIRLHPKARKEGDTTGVLANPTEV